MAATNHMHRGYVKSLVYMSCIKHTPNFFTVCDTLTVVSIYHPVTVSVNDDEEDHRIGKSPNTNASAKNY